MFASCPITSPIRSQITLPVASPAARELIGSPTAFHQSRIAVAFEHRVCHAPNVDLAYHAAKVRGVRLEGF